MFDWKTGFGDLDETSFCHEDCDVANLCDDSVKEDNSMRARRSQLDEIVKNIAGIKVAGVIKYPDVLATELAN